MGRSGTIECRKNDVKITREGEVFVRSQFVLCNSHQSEANAYVSCCLRSPTKLVVVDPKYCKFGIFGDYLGK
jgi:hypothetical protein